MKVINIFKFLALIIIYHYCLTFKLSAQINPNKPNILLIIADDLGVDATNGYHTNNLMPTTPTLDSLRANGLTFKNAWATPRCTPTRAAIMSGKYGTNTGVTRSPGNLDLVHTSIFKALEDATNNAYSDALIGKWHISSPTDYNHPSQHAIDHYEGVFTAQVSDYFNWTKVTGTTTSNETEYVTSNLTNAAIDWVNNQNQPWFLWLSHVAPHVPFHIPPANLRTLTAVGNNTRKYLAAIEAMDHEIGRLLNNIPSDVLANTIILFIGDNGTPQTVVRNFDYGKGTVYEGGVKVPLIVSGAGVNRINEQENALVHAADLYATILDIAGNSLDGDIYNSMSFNALLNNTNATSRPYNYSEITGNNNDGFCIRNEQYKYIEFLTGEQHFYDIANDTLEQNNLINNLTAQQVLIVEELQNEANQIRTDWSCNDLILNGTETAVDYGGTYCRGINLNSTSCNTDSLIICNEIYTDTFAFASNYLSDAHQIFSDTAVLKAGNTVCLESGFSFSGNQLSVDIETCNTTGIDDSVCTNENSTSYSNIGCCATSTISTVYSESVINNLRSITSNGFPNHDYCYSREAPTEMDRTFNMPASPSLAAYTTSILQDNNRPKYFFGIAINGVLIAPAPATPFIFENTTTGEYNWDWVFEPINNQGNGQGKVALDCASAHVGPQGYHYHGNMFEFAENLQNGLSTTAIAPANPILMGWAADGFPILYRFGPDETGNLKLLKPSYRLRYGNRGGNGIVAPCGKYNGKYTNDYEFVECGGDLDECNGVERSITVATSRGNETFTYFYVITDDFPQISRCFVGFPHSSFD